MVPSAWNHDYYSQVNMYTFSLYAHVGTWPLLLQGVAGSPRASILQVYLSAYRAGTLGNGPISRYTSGSRVASNGRAGGRTHNNG